MCWWSWVRFGLVKWCWVRFGDVGLKLSDIEWGGVWFGVVWRCWKRVRVGKWWGGWVRFGEDGRNVSWSNKVEIKYPSQIWFRLGDGVRFESAIRLWCGEIQVSWIVDIEAYRKIAFSAILVSLLGVTASEPWRRSCLNTNQIGMKTSRELIFFF